MQRLTVNEIADRLDMDREDVRGLVRFLVAMELVEPKGERKNENGGKPSNVYAFVDGFEKVLANRLKRAGLT